MNDKEKEKLRIQREQLRNFEERRAPSVQKLHDRLEKLKKLREHEEKN